MSTPTQDEIEIFLPNIPRSLLPIAENFLEFIDCPGDFRGLQKVHSALLYLFNVNPTYFSQIFEIEPQTLKQLLSLFSDTADSYYKHYSNPTHAKGWMSRRPLYSLLFIFYDHQNEQAATALLFFIGHYLRNESKIDQENRVESSIRAFRLLYTDSLVDRSCFSVDLQETDSALSSIITAIQEVRENLKSEENIDEDSSPSSRIGYLRELEHFYKLDWKKRRTYSRSKNELIRASYHRTKIERVIGSDYLYTASLKKTPINKSLIDAGITLAEDYPELHIIQTEQPVLPKPKHELPDIAVIKDAAIIKHKTHSISKDVRRSHNITPVSRNILQPHELNFLWTELTNNRNTLIQGIPRIDINCLLILILFTGRKLDAICNLPIQYDNGVDTVGLTLSPKALQLKVAPKPTADLGRHSKNPLLLKTKLIATLNLPVFLHGYFLKSHLRNHHTLSGLHSKPQYRKAVESWLKKLNQKYQCQISLKRIEYYLSNRLMAKETHDPVLLEILTGELSYYSRSPRHYAWYSETEINQKIQALWADIFEQVHLCSPSQQLPNILADINSSNKEGIGSQYTPSKAALSNWVTEYRLKLEQWRAFDVVKSLPNLIEYHNQYTIYTLIMLINASGYRAVYNPLPSFDLMLLRYHALCISDKDSSKNFSHTRVIACPTVLEQQLKHYQQHVQTMANLIHHLFPRESCHFYAQCCDHQLIDLPTKIEKIDWFLSVKNSHGNDGLFLLFLQNKSTKLESEEDISLRSQNAGPKYLSEFIELPLNFGRHYVRRYLQCNNVHQELIKFQLGHWVVGETPLEKCSSLIHSEAITKLLPFLDRMLDELNWQAIPSLVSRKRA
jgi:hypothetical protein